MQLNEKQLEVLADALLELSEHTGLSAAQIALLGDIRRELGIVTTIRATLGEGRVTYLPISTADGRTTYHRRGQR